MKLLHLLHSFHRNWSQLDGHRLLHPLLLRHHPRVGTVLPVPVLQGPAAVGKLRQLVEQQRDVPVQLHGGGQRQQLHFRRQGVLGVSWSLF